MRFEIDKLRRKGFLAAMALSAGMLWVGGTATAAGELGTLKVSATVAEGQEIVKEITSAAEGQGLVKSEERAIAGQQEVLYKDSGDAITVVGKEIRSAKYSSSNRDVAVVNEAGIVSGVDEGKTEITAEIKYEEEGELKTEKLSYQLEVIDNFTNYADVLNGEVRSLTEKGKALKEMHIPDYCNYIAVKSAKWDKILYKNPVVEKIFLSDHMEFFCERGISNAADAPQHLREVYLGRNVSVFGNLNGATAIERFAVHPDNQSFQVKEGVLYYEQTGLKCYPAAKKDASYTVPENVEYIDRYAFSGAKNLEKISLPKGLKYIHKKAFMNVGLTGIAIPANTELMEDAFVGCGKLQEVVIPNRVYGGDILFKDCPVLKTVIVPNTAKRISARCFSDCPSLAEFQMSPGASDFQVEDGVLLKRSTRELAAYPMGRKDTSYTVPKGIKCIGNGGFYGAENLKQIKLDDDLTDIDGDAFTNCSSLEKIRIPRRVKNIYYSDYGEGAGIFWGCTSLREISVASQNNYFSSSKGVLYNKSGNYLYRYPAAKRGSKFTVPKKVTMIMSCGMAQTRYLQKVVMKNSLKSIGSQVFLGGEKLRAVVLSPTLKTLSTGFFEDCRKLTKVTLPDKMVAVNTRLFAHCTGLREVILGKNVKKIKGQAFYDCANLRKITFKGKKWLTVPYNSYDSSRESANPFYKAGSKKYSRLTVYIPKCTKSQKKKTRKILLGNGLHKKAKIKFAK